VLDAFFGTDNITFTLPSEDSTVGARTFTTFQIAAVESAHSRELAGIHFLFDNQQGLVLGGNVGVFVANNHFGTDLNYSFVANLYHQLLQRTGSQPEIFTWVQRIEAGTYTQPQVGQLFLSSPEFIQLRNRHWVTLLYVQLLTRTPSQAEIKSWSDRLV